MSLKDHVITKDTFPSWLHAMSLGNLYRCICMLCVPINRIHFSVSVSIKIMSSDYCLYNAIAIMHLLDVSLVLSHINNPLLHMHAFYSFILLHIFIIMSPLFPVKSHQYHCDNNAWITATYQHYQLGTGGYT